MTLWRWLKDLLERLYDAVGVTDAFADDDPDHD